MSRIAAIVVLLLLPLAGATHPEPSPPQGSVWTVYTTVDAEIIDNYATVSIIADIGNRGPDPEFPFQVRVPADAYVIGFSIERDGTLWEGRIEDRDKARQEYDEQKANENTAGLIEKKRGTQIYAFLVNVAEFESVRAILTYEVYLSADQDVYSLGLEAPVSGFGEDLGARFDVRVCHEAGVTSLTTDPPASAKHVDGCRSASHSVGPRHNEQATPFSLHYAIPPTAEEGNLQAVVVDGVGYFAHPFRAPANAAQLPLDLVLVLDTSGSMGAEHKLAQMQDAATQVIGMLDEADRLAIVEFNSGTFTSMGSLEAAGGDRVAAGRRLVQEFFAGGSTNIEAGLRDGFGAYDGTSACDSLTSAVTPCLEPRSRILVFLTDGQATVGITGRDALRTMALDENPGDVRLFALAFGTGADYRLVSGLAKDNGGSALLVPQGDGAEVDLRRFMAALATPVLENVVIDYDGEVQAFRNSAPVLFQGSELLVVGTFDASMKRITGTVTGDAANGPQTYTFDQAVGPGNSKLPRIVAYAQIQHYQGLIDAEGEQAAWVAAIKEIALEWGFVTEYTSLVISTALDDPVRTFDPESRHEGAADGASGGATSTGTSTSSHTGSQAPSTTGGQANDSDSTPGGQPPAEKSEPEDGANTPGLGLPLALAALAAVAVALRRRR